MTQVDVSDERRLSTVEQCSLGFAPELPQLYILWRPVTVNRSGGIPPMNCTVAYIRPLGPRPASGWPLFFEHQMTLDGASLSGVTHFAPLQGRAIECFSHDDAVKITTASRILRGTDSAPSTRQLARIMITLNEYACGEAAEALSHRIANPRPNQNIAALDCHAPPSG